MWRGVIQGKFGKEEGSWISKEGREGLGMSLWKASEEDGMLSNLVRTLLLVMVLGQNSGLILGMEFTI